MKEDPSQHKYCFQAYEELDANPSTSYIYTEIFIQM